MTATMMTRFVFFICVLLTTGCYRMPDENEVSTLPNTNNPTLTRQKPQTMAPGVAY
ncbi:MAG: hypothetical protein JSR46_06705 [Verrucomicrobia bacterium]|nr:hypothetical protein [Verrucomicrobiota bacterium]